MTGSLLLLDDDPLMLRILGDTLKPAGFTCISSRTIDEAARAAKRHPPQAAIVDVNLENGESGLELVRTWRVERQFPVIVLSSQGQAIDRIIGLEMGAEDYIVKPFEPRELILRVTRVIERFNYVSTATDRQPCWDLGNAHKFDPGSRAIFNAQEKLSLSTAEFNLMSYLIKNGNRLVTRDQILDAVHQRLHESSDRSVDMLITRLRKKISDSQVEIKAIRGAGYMLVGPLQLL
jgi:two-component system OmpR family response regulator